MDQPWSYMYSPSRSPLPPPSPPASSGSFQCTNFIFMNRFLFDLICSGFDQWFAGLILLLVTSFCLDITNMSTVIKISLILWISVAIVWAVSLLLSHIQLFVTPWTLACQAPLSEEFSRKEYWSGLPFRSPWDLHCNWVFPHCRQILYHLSHQGIPRS